MFGLIFNDYRSDPGRLARELAISQESVELYLQSDVIDLHIETFVWNRVFGYDLTRRHGRGLLGARLYGQVDLPRLREARVTGGVWAITTNPFRLRSQRPEIFERNLGRLERIFKSCPSDVTLVRSVAEYRQAVDSGRHAAWVAVQGGNAFDGDLDRLDRIPNDWVIAVTLVHLSHSSLGRTSSPYARGEGQSGLSDSGKDFVRRLNAKRILVDLAHVNRRGFFDAVAIHDRSQPLTVTHTGVAGVYPHWRNIDDQQLRAIAQTGGTVGVMYQSSFLGDRWLGGRASRIVDHLEHIVKVVGEDFASLGSDWDGCINPPRDMPTCLELPRLVQLMLDRGWTPERIRKILGGNFLRVVQALRG